MRRPAVQADSLMGDVLNALLLRPPYRRTTPDDRIPLPLHNGAEPFRGKVVIATTEVQQ